MAKLAGGLPRAAAHSVDGLAEKVAKSFATFFAFVQLGNSRVAANASARKHAYTVPFPLPVPLPEIRF
jgi:hypothetical protein